MSSVRFDFEGAGTNTFSTTIDGEPPNRRLFLDVGGSRCTIYEKDENSAEQRLLAILVNNLPKAYFKEQDAD